MWLYGFWNLDQLPDGQQVVQQRVAGGDAEAGAGGDGELRPGAVGPQHALDEVDIVLFDLCRVDSLGFHVERLRRRMGYGEERNLYFNYNN